LPRDRHLRVRGVPQQRRGFSLSVDADTSSRGAQRRSDLDAAEANPLALHQLDPPVVGVAP